MKRLTAERMNGIKTGYWSASKKEELVQRLAEYENIGLEPEEIRKQIQQYREMDRKLREAYGDCDGLLERTVDLLCEHAGIDIGEPIRARLLTDEDIDKWDAYREIGTVEECRRAVEKQKHEAGGQVNRIGDGLISRKALLDSLRGNVLVDVTSELEEAIEDQPTAFDKEKVMKQFQEVADLSVEDGLWRIELQEAFAIVKKGGIE